MLQKRLVLLVVIVLVVLNSVESFIARLNFLSSLALRTEKLFQSRKESVASVTDSTIKSWKPTKSSRQKVEAVKVDEVEAQRVVHPQV
jgi:hypothetical protein